MDRVSCLAYILFKNKDDEVKRLSLDLLVGDVTVREIRKMNHMKKHLAEAEHTLDNSRDFNIYEVAKFVEEFMLTV
ncbi:hypothetical protein ACFYKX_19715 [Cytobacillus sp. FJAT-54145]|uniref:Uncharacterized protein n=1 Tax=Cytobacillus spartinae TaxID=3299023 RepID=A0ABW6KF91_9BACI